MSTTDIIPQSKQWDNVNKTEKRPLYLSNYYSGNKISNRHHSCHRLPLVIFRLLGYGGQILVHKIL
jgi:hypothetical protein